MNSIETRRVIEATTRMLARDIYIYIFIHASGTWLDARGEREREGGGRARVHRARKSFAKLQAVNFSIFSRASAIFSTRISPPRRDNTSPSHTDANIPPRNIKFLVKCDFFHFPFVSLRPTYTFQMLCTRILNLVYTCSETIISVHRWREASQDFN